MAMKKVSADWLLYLFPILVVTFQLVTYKSPGFHRDELLYFSLGEHPAAGYYSVPPFTGIVALISANLFGFSLFAAKFFPAIAGGLIVLITGLIAKEMKGGIFAQVLASVSFLSSLLFIRAFSLFQPVPFDILFWTLLFWILIKYLNKERSGLLLFFGVITGIGFLNKYNIVFLIAPIIGVLLISKHRKVFSRRYFWYAIAITVILVTPNIIWQINHGMPVIDHMEELRSSQLVNMDAFTFILEQFLMVFPATLIILPGLIYLLVSKHLKNYRIAGVIAVTVLLLFIVLKGKSYYSAGIYPMLSAAGAVFAERKIRDNRIRTIIAVTILAIGYIVLPMGKPIYEPQRLVAYFDKVEKFTGNNAIRRDEDNKYNKLPQDYSDMLGWDELASITASAWNQVIDKEGCIIFCENYGQAGAITILGKKYGLPNPVSFSESFIYWAPRNFKHPITTVIYINDNVGSDVKTLFNSIYKEGAISNSLAREKGTGVYLCTEPLRDFNQFWESQFEEQ